MNLADATVTQILIPIDDFERGVTFYRDVLGLHLLFAAPPQMRIFSVGGKLSDSPWASPCQIKKGQRGSQIYFAVQDIQAVHSSLSNQGVQFKALPHVVNRSAKSELWLAEFVDPDGNQLALMSEVP